ncbi:Uu.00g080320.m01.CDS01 [Anthostomella pinea]|uniref:Uu.00g080320.m01.CDS01 n=1 Tax=Anthostomella pinea TaxID=933095 RepID=A0AAI8VKZ2_9PEZI|nr:Uu.00g080320.m01.CDS01 [Anthostomella pinea]
MRGMHEPHEPHVQDEDFSPSEDGDEPLDIDQDEVESIIQPALSPVATRLSSQKTPAAEKAAAMDRLPDGGLSSVMEGIVTTEPYPMPSPSTVYSDDGPAQGTQTTTKPQTRQSRGFSLGQLPSSLPQARFPSPWHAGPKEIIVEHERSSRPALSSVFGQNRHRRSSSGGPDTLRRIREAMPSISLPSFFGGPSAKSPDLDGRRRTASVDGAAESKQVEASPKIAAGRTGQPENRAMVASPLSQAFNVSAPSRPSSMLSVRPRTIRRSTSDESMLYHSLSRVSSLGDDDKWKGVREQKNSRLKAITDSWDKPTFKLPQFPNIIPAPLKKNSMLGSETSDSHPMGVTRPAPISESRDELMSELDRALEALTGDVVVMGGYRGSVLRSTKNNRQVWVPVKVGLNIRKVNLEVGLDPEDEERMEETIYSSGMLQNIGPVDISRRLFKRLRECDNARKGNLRVWDYGYDWRLSPHILSRKLLAFLEQLPSNQGTGRAESGATVIAHSLGGLITRHAVNQRPELFSGVIYAGTPQRCINILGPIRNGDAVLFNEKVLTAQVNFSLRTSFVLLPEDGFCFINKYTGEEYPVDFYDALEWAKYSISPCIEAALPAYNARNTPLGSFRELSGRLPTPLRSRGNSAAGEEPNRNPVAEVARKAEVAHDRTLAPQIGTLSGDQQKQTNGQGDLGARSRNMAYLSRTLADTKTFRAETHHQPRHSDSNSYPPLAIIYGKEVPTVWGAHVTSREAIACTDAYDDLVFRSGDGVVLAKEAMLPEGYALAKGGRVSTDRGHITMLGDLEAVGRALQAVIRGRRKGIGLGRRVLDTRREAAQLSEPCHP